MYLPNYVSLRYMASTRALNQPRDYCLQQRSYDDAFRHIEYKHGPTGTPLYPAFPTVGAIPSRFNWNDLAFNPVEIENVLWGINANNLVQPRKPVTPRLKQIRYAQFFEREPVILPEPFIPLSGQRPFVIPQ
jgi:hypothetical protein